SLASKPMYVNPTGTLATLAVALQLTAAAPAATPPSVPHAVVDGLRSVYGIGIDQNVADPPPISERRAVRIASREFAWSGGPATSAFHVRFTDPNHGVHYLDGTIAPTWGVWLVIIPDTTHFAFGGPPSSPTTFKATLCVF